MSPQRVTWIALLLERPPSGDYEGSRLHIARHDVDWHEVEEACLYGNPDRTVWVPSSPPGTRLLRVYARTLAGRPLLCILKPAPEVDDDAYYVVTAHNKEAR